MVAKDFLPDPQVRQWLDGVEPAWTLLTFESLRRLRQEPSAVQTAVRNYLSVDEVVCSPVARNTLLLLRQTIERDGFSNRDRKPVESRGGRLGADGQRPP